MTYMLVYQQRDLPRFLYAALLLITTTAGVFPPTPVGAACAGVAMFLEPAGNNSIATAAHYCSSQP